MATAALTYEAPTRMIGRSLILGPGDWQSIPGGKVIGSHRRKIIITNEDVNTRVYLVKGPEQNVNPDNETVKILTIKVDDRVELETNSTIYVKNVSGTETVSTVQILELYYDDTTRPGT
jgi:hypothetical protein